MLDGNGVAGICLIRMGGVRPAGLPAWAGLRSENAAQRVAVAFVSADGAASVDVAVSLAAPRGSSVLFHDMAEASAFFEAGSVGYSPSTAADWRDCACTPTPGACRP